MIRLLLVLCQTCMYWQKASSQLDVRWFGSHLYVCVMCMPCACMHAYVHVDSHLRNRKLEHEDSVSSVSPPRMLSYEAREAYAPVMRLIFVSCAYVRALSSHMLQGRGIQCIRL